MKLTEKWLKDNEACQSGIDFVVRNKLLGFPFELIGELKGDHYDFAHWLKMESKNKLTYDENNNVTFIETDDGYYIRKAYDKNNNVIYTCRSTDKTLQTQTIETWSEYDDNNNLIFTKNDDGEITHFKYDEKNNLISTQFSAFSKLLYQYDENNNLIVVIKEVHRGRQVIQQYEYDDDNNQIMAIYPSRSFQYAYDENKNIIYKESSDGDKHEYRYDENKNLIYVKYLSNECEAFYKSELYPDGQLKSYGTLAIPLYIPYFEKYL
jgi:YD repeat-containing protein